jgi:hypothetical protein
MLTPRFRLVSSRTAKGRRVTRNELVTSPSNTKNWVTNRSQKWGGPVLEARRMIARICGLRSDGSFTTTSDNLYVNDGGWGLMFVRICTYFPLSARVCLNQHHWLANRMREEKIDFRQCSNAFLKCSDPKRLQEMANSLRQKIC